MKRWRSWIALCWIAAAPAAAAGPGDPLTEDARANRTFVLGEFVSETCPACDEMASVVRAVLEKYPQVHHQVYDADRQVDLAKKYGVRCVPVYVVVDPQGQVRFNDVGVRTVEELEAILRQAGVPPR
ncbi:MAG: hypothetical protein Kow0092_04490 [Deferrisomatales bacterium]